MSGLTTIALKALARRGFVVQRHPAARRQRLLDRHGVDVVLDVGAARGGHARELRDFGYRGRIVSFEPLSAAYSDLARAAADDPDWTTVNVAMGATAGPQQINIATNSDSSSLLPLGALHVAAAPHVGYTDTEQIDVVRLDDVAGEHLAGARRPFLKLDVQGFEREVLTGGADTIPRLTGLQLELSFVSLYDGGILADEAISFLYDAGFRLVSFAQGFTGPGGDVLQVDGVFFRTTEQR